MRFFILSFFVMTVFTNIYSQKIVINRNLDDKIVLGKNVLYIEQQEADGSIFVFEYFEDKDHRDFQILNRPVVENSETKYPLVQAYYSLEDGLIRYETLKIIAKKIKKGVYSPISG